jgi:hypothetical protein
MIKKIVQWFKNFDEWDKNLTRGLVEDTFQLETFGQFLRVVLPFALGWLLFWNGQHVGPFLDAVFGTGPHDLDSYGKIVWRRIYGSILCGPFITYAVIRYGYNLWKRSRDSNMKND